MLSFSSPEPLPAAHIHVDYSSPGGTVSPDLYGHDLEFTRHDLFEGLSAEMLANRKFATLVDATAWPEQVQELAAAGVHGAARWEAIGNASIDTPLWANASALVSGDLGHSIRCDRGVPCGVRQRGWLDGFNAGASTGSAIAVAPGVEYELRLVLRSAAGGSAPSQGGAVRASLTSATGALLWSRAFPLPAASAGWSTVQSVLNVSATSTNATLAIVETTAPAAAWWLGSASLARADATPEGLRPDVVAAVRATNFRGLLRYPGGCFSSFYRWKVGLLPADRRPPIATPPGFCAAVPGGVNAYTDGVVANGIGTDEYMSLVRHLGATAAVTVRLSLGDAGEIAEAREWVEYLNGDSSTRYGALRARRGHAAPYGVRYFYLGNELWQERCPHYPRDTACTPGPNATEYARIARALVAAMQAASPTPLRLLTAMSANPDDGWDQAWIDAVGPHIYAASDHDGYHTQPASFDAPALTACAKAPRDIFAPQLRRRRAALDAKGAPHVAISADEWGLGPPWTVTGNFSVAHGVYAAAFLGMSARIAPEVRLAFTNYFEPVNEGAVYVGPFGAALTTVGEVMALYADHAGGALLHTTPHDEELDVLATLHEAAEGAGGASLRVTVASLNATDWRARPLALTLEPPPPKGTAAAVLTLTASGFDERSTFARGATTATVGEAGTLSLTIPPFSIVSASVDL